MNLTAEESLLFQKEGVCGYEVKHKINTQEGSLFVCSTSTENSIW